MRKRCSAGHHHNQDRRRNDVGSLVLIPLSHRRRGATKFVCQNRHHRSDSATPPVFYHSFPLPVTHLFFFAVLLRNQGGLTAEPRRCHCGHGDPIELKLRFDGGATSIIGGRTAVLAAISAGPVRYHCKAVLLRCYCGCAAEAGRLHDVPAAAIYGMWFSVVFPFSLLLRTLNVIKWYYCFYHLVMPPKRATPARSVGLGKASKKTPNPTRRLYCGGKAVMEVPLRSLHALTAVMAVPRRSQCGLSQPAVELRKF